MGSSMTSINFIQCVCVCVPFYQAIFVYILTNNKLHIHCHVQVSNDYLFSLCCCCCFDRNVVVQWSLVEWIYQSEMHNLLLHFWDIKIENFHSKSMSNNRGRIYCSIFTRNWWNFHKNEWIMKYFINISAVHKL